MSCGKAEGYLAVLLVVAAGLIAGSMCYVFLYAKSPLYSAAIDSVAGLDGGDLGRRPADLNPLFNLTLRVTTRSMFTSGCTHTGAAVEVTYAGAKLAAKPRKTKEQAAVAWGTAVHVPGFALDGLAADAQRGAPVFDVAVMMPGNHASNHHGMLVSCTGLHVGDGSTLGAPCAVSDVDTVMSVPSDKAAGTS